MKMDYFVLGTNNMYAAITFYDSLFKGTKAEKVVASERMTYWLSGETAFAVATPFDGESATNGNGTMLGFSVETPQEVTRLYNLAIDMGGTCEGEPGQRGPRFSAYVRDLDKNKVCFSS